MRQELQYVSVRLPKAAVAELRKRAADDLRPLAQYLRRMLLKSLEPTQ
jgi:hypothetical protein